MKWTHFESRLSFTATLTARTGLRVGAAGEAGDPTASDLPVIKDTRGNPFIPGSSLRGALRSHIERIVRTFEVVGTGRGACNPLVMSQETKETMHACVTNEQADGWRKESRTRNDAGLYFAEQVWQQSCRICRVFGSPWLASRVRISDLACVNADQLRIEIRDGVAIHREKETVENKFDFETVPVGSRFALEILAENLDEQERGLLWIGLEELRQGQILLGGFKGRGLGRVTLENERLQLVQDKQGLRTYLLTGEMPDCAAIEAKRWVKSLVNSFPKEG